MKTALLAFAFILLATLPVPAWAHGSGTSFEKIIGVYLVDIGYSVPAPQDGEPVSFDFSLQKTNSGENVPFDDVWVKIESDDTQAVVFASGIHNASFGGPRLNYVFPHAGKYTVFARFETEGGSLAETSFPITVTPAGEDDTNTSLQSSVYGLLGLLIGACAVYLWGRRALLKTPSTGA